MIATSKAPIRFIPPWYDQESEESPAFMIRPGSVNERGIFEAELAGAPYRAGRVFPFQVMEAFISGISTLLADDPGRDELIALAHQEAAEEELSAEDKATLERVREILCDHWPPFQILDQRGQRRAELLPILAFRRFVTGWSGFAEAMECVKGFDGLVTDATAASVPSIDMRIAGQQAYSMLYGATQEKNSERPSS